MDEVLSLIKEYSHAIRFKAHAMMRLNERKIDRDIIIQNIQNPVNLIACNKQSDNRYVLIFRETKRKLLMVVIKFENESIYVITALPTTKKLSKLVRKWQK